MPRLRAYKVDVSEERQLAIGCIVSDSFLAIASSSVDLDLLGSNNIRDVVSWCIDHHKNFGKAPGRLIEDIFQVK